jgi:integrase
MAAIRRDVLKNGKSRYRVRVRVNGGYRSATKPNRAEARRWADATERELTLNRLSPLGQSEILTFGDLVDKYRRQVLPYKKWRTQRQQEQQLRWWVEYLGADRPLVRISPPVISDAKEALLPLSPGTVNRYLAILSHLFAQAVKEWRCVDSNPVASVGRLPEPRGRTRWLKSDERRRLMDACNATDNRFLGTIVTLGLATGARSSEIRRMRWDMLDLFRSMMVDGRQVEVGRYYLEETKTDEARALIIFGEALQLMRRLYRERRPGSVWCFPSSRETHQPIDFRYAWEQALIASRVENFCFHDLRHSAASYLGEQGASLAQIGAILGHKTANTTKRYTHFTSSGTEHLVAKMNGSIFGRV